MYVWALLVSNRGTRTAVELRDDGFGFFAVRPQSETKGLLITSQKLPSPVGRPWLVSESGAVALPSSGSFATTDPAAFPSPDPKPNVGTYVGVPSAVARYQGPTTWYMFVFAQDVNTVPQGTDPREAAKTIGGMLLTNNYVIGFNDDPCELNYDAVVTVV